MSTLKKTTGLLLLLGAGTVIFMACQKPKEPINPTTDTDTDSDNSSDQYVPPTYTWADGSIHNTPSTDNVQLTLPDPDEHNFNMGVKGVNNQNPDKVSLSNLVFYQ